MRLQYLCNEWPAIRSSSAARLPLRLTSLSPTPIHTCNRHHHAGPYRRVLDIASDPTMSHIYGRLRVHRDSCRCHPRVGGTSYSGRPTKDNGSLGSTKTLSECAQQSAVVLRCRSTHFAPPRHPQLGMPLLITLKTCQLYIGLGLLSAELSFVLSQG